MDTQPTFGLTNLVGEIAGAVSDRNGESQHQRLVRTQAAAHTIMAFHPHDAIEAMLAGHCLMFHELIVESVHATMRGEEPATRRATRSGIVAMDKAFGNNLVHLAGNGDSVRPGGSTLICHNPLKCEFRDF
jgi:hypothetical protein